MNKHSFDIKKTMMLAVKQYFGDAVIDKCGAFLL